MACSANSALNAGIGLLNACDNKSAMLDEGSPLGLFFVAPSVLKLRASRRGGFFDEGYGSRAKVTDLFDRSTYVSC